MERAHTTTLVILAAFVTGLFVLANVVAALFFIYATTNLAWIQWMSRYWADLCFAYVLFQFIPVIVAFSISEKEYRVDRYTTPFAVLTALGMIILFAFFVRGGPDGWQITRYTGFAALLDLLFVAGMWYMRRDARLAAR